MATAGISVTPIQVRDATDLDLSAILEIYNDAILTTTAVYQYEPHTLEMRRTWLHEKQAAGYPVLVAEVDGRIAGFGNLGVWRAAAAYKYTVENSVYVAKDLRGRGIGKRLLGALIDEARAMDRHAIVAVIDADNAVSIGLHEAFGFERAARFKQVGRKFGRWLDLVFMELVLETPEQPQE
jgi:phosphinothricin acetyltransferase